MFRIPTTENTLQLLSDVRRGQWFVHDYESLLPVALSFLKGEKFASTPRPDFEFSTTEAKFSAAAIGNESPAREIAVIPIIGTITKYDTCFTYGAMTYARAIVMAAEHPKVCGIVLDFDSGGGAMNAISILKEAIHHAQQLGKPIIAHTDFCASLAYWAASQCDAIFCDNSLSAVGSIGGLFEFIDDTKKLEKDGYTVVSVYADESPDKNLPYRQALEGDTTLIRQNLSHSIAQFHQDIKAGRPDIKEDAIGVFTGAMFHPNEAKSLGLINGVMTLSECIENTAIRAQYNH